MTQERTKKVSEKIKTVIVLAAAIIFIILWIKLSGVPAATSPVTSSQSPAYRLATYDSNQEPSAVTVSKYQTALDNLKTLCAEDDTTLAAEIWASWKDLQKNGVSDETNLSLIAHIEKSIPPKTAPVECRGVMAAYLTLREPIK
jgi:hypothetical protein